MRGIIFIAGVFLFSFFSPQLYPQIIGFYPAVDTLLTGGGCTAPEIICHEFTTTDLQDSIAIDPGWNTWMFVMDSLGNRIDFDNGYFLVDDSLDQYEYEIRLHSEFYPSILIPFDSSFMCDFWKFDIQLIVKEQGLPIDSLSQPFRADYGLGVADEENALLNANQIKLFQNYPNPFNPVTNIYFFLPKSGPVKIEVFDLIGRKMATVLSSMKPAGSHFMEFDGSNLASGIYFYRIFAQERIRRGEHAGQFVDVKKMILMK